MPAPDHRVTCHSAKIIASGKSKIARILYKFFPHQSKIYWKDPPKIPCIWEPEYILTQLICSYPVGTFLSFKGEKQVPVKGFSLSIGLVLAPGAVDFHSAVRLRVTRIIFALRARKEQIFYQHLNHLSSAGEEGLNAQLHTCKLMRTSRGDSEGISYLCKLDLSVPGTVSSANRSVCENPKHLCLSRCPCHYSASQSDCLRTTMMPVSLPNGAARPGTWESGVFLWIFWGVWGLALLLCLFLFTDPPPLAQKWQ